MDMAKIARLGTYGVAGIAGLVGANYVSNAIAANKYAAYGMIVGGVASLAIAGVVLKDGKESWAGPARLLLALTGVTLLVRGVVTVAGYRTQLNAITQGVM